MKSNETLARAIVSALSRIITREDCPNMHQHANKTSVKVSVWQILTFGEIWGTVATRVWKKKEQCLQGFQILESWAQVYPEPIY